MVMYAIQVTTGQELLAKEKLEYVLKKKGITSVKSIFAGETHTEFVTNSNGQVVENVSLKKEVNLYLERVRINNAINNCRQQLQALDRYRTKEYETLKLQYKQTILELERKIRSLKSVAHKIKSVLQGYILVELDDCYATFPNDLYHLVKSIPNILKLVNKYPISAEEKDYFFEQIHPNIEPEIEMTLDNELSYKEEYELKTKLVSKLNDSNSIEEKQVIEEELNLVTTDVVSTVNQLFKRVLKAKKEQAKSLAVNPIKAFVRRYKTVVSMPKSVFLSLYNEEERTDMKKYLHNKDFIQRFKNYIQKLLSHEQWVTVNE